jgi:succinate-semialdehyde dehydrogenase/glutarate-semialdehyde dehydrogenase
VLAGGAVPDGPGAYYPQTVLAGCTDDMRVVTDETFGPVAPVITMSSFEDALQHAGRSRYGPAATVLTASMSNAHRAARAAAAAGASASASASARNCSTR